VPGSPDSNDRFRSGTRLNLCLLCATRQWYEKKAEEDRQDCSGTGNQKLTPSRVARNGTVVSGNCSACGFDGIDNPGGLLEAIRKNQVGRQQWLAASGVLASARVHPLEIFERRNGLIQVCLSRSHWGVRPQDRQIVAKLRNLGRNFRAPELVALTDGYVSLLRHAEFESGAGESMRSAIETVSGCRDRSGGRFGGP
jgi:hypothetical protein